MFFPEGVLPFPLALYVIVKPLNFDYTLGAYSYLNRGASLPKHPVSHHCVGSSLLTRQYSKFLLCFVDCDIDIGWSVCLIFLNAETIVQQYPFHSHMTTINNSTLRTLKQCR